MIEAYSFLQFNMPRCGAKGDGCLALHSRHYCRLCEDDNSDHLSRHCPTGTILYHGTTRENAISITGDVLKSSKDGRLGSGVYFVGKEKEAMKIAQYRARQDGDPSNWAVLTCNVNLGRMDDWTHCPSGILKYHLHHKEVLAEIDKGYKYDSNFAMHPPWAGIKDKFGEYCLKNYLRCNVMRRRDEQGVSIVIAKRAIPVTSTHSTHDTDGWCAIS